jgi:hypothetical protein
VDHRVSNFRLAAGVLAGLGLLAPAVASAAPPAPANPTYGHWAERDLKLDFEIRPGAKPDQVMLIIPKDVTFPGSHQFLLTKRAGGSFEAAEPGRPKVALAFKSSSQANLKVRGHGSTATGAWMAINDYTLVRR